MTKKEAELFLVMHQNNVILVHLIFFFKTHGIIKREFYLFKKDPSTLPLILF
jgi:hypothetical protein